MSLHRCEPEWAEKDSYARSGYGPAITLCHENERGELWVENDEYSSRVNFCPFCGKSARHPVVEVSDDQP